MDQCEYVLRGAIGHGHTTRRWHPRHQNSQTNVFKSVFNCFTLLTSDNFEYQNGLRFAIELMNFVA